MTLIKKADVKNHFSARRHKNLLPFRPASQSGLIGNMGSKLDDGTTRVPGSGPGEAPSAPIRKE